MAGASEPAGPIRLAYIEGDVSGMSTLLNADGATLGFIEYHQHRRGEILEITRIARFDDGSSDEDQVEAEVGKTLRSVRGRTIIRNTKGTPTVDVTIDVASGRIKGFSGLGEERETYDETFDLTPATYWGPLLGIVLKNFDQNAVGENLIFHTVVMTPKPRAFDMEFVRKQKTSLKRSGQSIDVVEFGLLPKINFLLDPIIRMFSPETGFFVMPGKPPGLASYRGPRNYAGQLIRIE